MKNSCSICGKLKNHEYTYNKEGQDECQRFPDAFYKLINVKELTKGYTSRPHTILKCPKCETYYYHKVGYEYLVEGTENEEWLDRLNDKDAKKYLA